MFYAIGEEIKNFILVSALVMRMDVSISGRTFDSVGVWTVEGLEIGYQFHKP